MKNAAEVKIHIIMSDSRPSPDLFTPTIRNLFPTKICFNVSAAKDSKFFIGQAGGEKLLGCGDLLITSPVQNNVIRLQAPYISDKEQTKLIKSIPPRKNPFPGLKL